MLEMADSKTSGSDGAGKFSINEFKAEAKTFAESIVDQTVVSSVDSRKVSFKEPSNSRDAQFQELIVPTFAQRLRQGNNMFFVRSSFCVDDEIFDHFGVITRRRMAGANPEGEGNINEELSMAIINTNRRMERGFDEMRRSFECLHNTIVEEGNSTRREINKRFAAQSSLNQELTGSLDGFMDKFEGHLKVMGRTSLPAPGLRQQSKNVTENPTSKSYDDLVGGIGEVRKVCAFGKVRALPPLPMKKIPSPSTPRPMKNSTKRYVGFERMKSAEAKRRAEKAWTESCKRQKEAAASEDDVNGNGAAGNGNEGPGARNGGKDGENDGAGPSSETRYEDSPLGRFSVTPNRR